MKKILLSLLMLSACMVQAQTTPLLPSGYVPFSTQIYRKISGTDTSYVTGASGKGFTVIPDSKSVKNNIQDNRTNIPENKRISVLDSIKTAGVIVGNQIQSNFPTGGIAASVIGNDILNTDSGNYYRGGLVIGLRKIDNTGEPLYSSLIPNSSLIPSKNELPPTSGVIANSNDLARKSDNNTVVHLTDKGVANGVATLDASGKLPLSQVNDALLGAVNYKGVYNAATNNPALPAAATDNKGYYYIVSTAGTQFGLTLATGDWIISNGTAYSKVDNNNSVTSVEGRTGAVIVSKADLGLSQVDNTQDVNKPISIPTQNALNNKANLIGGNPNWSGNQAGMGYVGMYRALVMTGINFNMDASEKTIQDGFSGFVFQDPASGTLSWMSTATSLPSGTHPSFPAGVFTVSKDGNITAGGTGSFGGTVTATTINLSKDVNATGNINTPQIQLGAGGNLTAAGTGTFGSTVTSSAVPTLGSHLTNKLYVDGLAATKSPNIGSPNYIQNLSSGTQTGGFRIANDGLIMGSLHIGNAGGSGKFDVYGSTGGLTIGETFVGGNVYRADTHYFSTWTTGKDIAKMDSTGLSVFGYIKAIDPTNLASNARIDHIGNVGRFISSGNTSGNAGATQFIQENSTGSISNTPMAFTDLGRVLINTQSEDGTGANLQVNGTISAALPTQSAHVSTKGYVDARILSGSAVIDFPNISGPSGVTTGISFPGAVPGDVVMVGTPNYPIATQYVWFSASCASADIVLISAYNIQQSNLDLPSLTYNLKIIR